jgi:hypothetical protein
MNDHSLADMSDYAPTINGRLGNAGGRKTGTRVHGSNTADGS